MKARELAEILLQHPDYDVTYADNTTTPIGHIIASGIQIHEIKTKSGLPDRYFVLYEVRNARDDNNTTREILR